jgi:hypothetical protein
MKYGRRVTIVSWALEERHASYGMGSYLHGIWFNYEIAGR